MEEAKAHELYLDLKKADRAAKAKKVLEPAPQPRMRSMWCPEGAVYL